MGGKEKIQGLQAQRASAGGKWGSDRPAASAGRAVAHRGARAQGWWQARPCGSVPHSSAGSSLCSPSPQQALTPPGSRRQPGVQDGGRYRSYGHQLPRTEDTVSLTWSRWQLCQPRAPREQSLQVLYSESCPGSPLLGSGRAACTSDRGGGLPEAVESPLLPALQKGLIQHPAPCWGTMGRVRTGWGHVGRASWRRQPRGCSSHAALWAQVHPCRKGTYREPTPSRG